MMRRSLAQMFRVLLLVVVAVGTAVAFGNGPAIAKRPPPTTTASPVTTPPSATPSPAPSPTRTPTPTPTAAATCLVPSSDPVTRNSTWSQVPATGSCPYSVALLASFSPPRLMISNNSWIWFYVPAGAGQPVAPTYGGQSFTYHSDQPNGIYGGAAPLPSDCEYC